MSGARASDDRGGAISQVDRFEQDAEVAIAAMYEARHATDAAGHYSSAKEALHDAIAAARAAGDAERVDRLAQRLAHVKAVFRSQAVR